ncbi:Uncharacterised protein [Bordetella pertussis]|nr:Uncharacterised protein [Bordetella pertussis]
MNWSSCSALTTAGSTRVMSPTSPMSSGWLGSSLLTISFLVAWMSMPSLPVRPTALPPTSLIIMTMSCWTCPPSTHSTTSMVSASVTRMPCTKVPCLPMRRSASSICGPPPCTTTGFRPTSLSSTTSWAKLRCNRSSVIALPPYFTTMVLPWNRRIYGRASDSTAALTAGDRTAAGSGVSVMATNIRTEYKSRMKGQPGAGPRRAAPSLRPIVVFAAALCGQPMSICPTNRLHSGTFGGVFATAAPFSARQAGIRPGPRPANHPSRGYICV